MAAREKGGCRFMADSVEKLLQVTLDHVLEGASPLAPGEVVDPGPI